MHVSYFTTTFYPNEHHARPIILLYYVIILLPAEVTHAAKAVVPGQILPPLPHRQPAQRENMRRTYIYIDYVLYYYVYYILYYYI